MTHFLQKAKKFEIEAYKKKPGDIEALKHTHISFSGSPLKHPSNPEKIILVSDPCSTLTFYYEFRVKDISYIEELPNLVNPDNETVNMVRIWVKKRSVGVRCSPFLVEAIKSI